MLEVQGLYKKLEGFLLQNVNIKLPKGYIMGLIGENGAGKTTLLHLILGLYQPTEGLIRINGMTYVIKRRKIKISICFCAGT